ncbi:MAG: MFS transporter [Gemmatimonadota bacterium]|nr:MAG: MFS transporter [Gemmatimonadota bacterium]
MPAETANRKSLPPVVRQFGVVSFLNDLASEMVYPLLPALITSRLGAGALALGALDGIAEAVAAGTKLMAGRVADNVRRRRPTVVWGYAVAAVARPIMAHAASAWQVIALRAADRTGKGMRNPPRDAVIADASPPAIRGRAFGYHRSMDHAGAVAGPLIAWILLSAAGMTPSQVIAWSIVPGALAVAVVVWATRHIGKVRSELGDRAAPESSSNTDEPAPAIHSSKSLLSLIMLFALARFPETLFLLRLQDVGVAVALVPALWAALHVVRALGSYPGGWLSDRIGPRLTMLLGWASYAIVCLGLALAARPLVATAWFLGFGAVTTLTESPERAFVTGFTARRRGTRFGIYHAGVGVAGLVGGLTFGAIYAAAGGVIALNLSAGLGAVLVAAGTFTRQ